MKKLMTMLAAVGMAFGLFADTPSPIQTDGFEDTWAAANWTLNDADTSAFFTQAVYQASEVREENLPYAFDTVGQKYLELKTGLDPAKSLSWANTDQENIGAGIYFDGLVRFEACDETNAVALTTEGGAKLAVFTYLDEEAENAEEHLFVAAGFMGEDWEVKYYDCGPLSNYEPDVSGFNRITIRAIEQISTDADKVPGFIVFVNGINAKRIQADTGIGDIDLEPTAAAWNAKRSLFPSIEQVGVDGYLKVASVDFAGHGSIDDVILTREVPGEFAKDFFFSISADDKVTSFKYSVNKAAPVLVEGREASVPLTGADMEVTISDVEFVESTYEEWGATLVAGSQCTADGMTFSIPETAEKPNGQLVSKDCAPRITIGSNTYATFTEAIAAISQATGPVTMTLGRDIIADFDTESGTTEAFIESTYDVTLDLAGKIITSKTGAGASTFVLMCQSPNFTIKDTLGGGKIVALEGEGGAVQVGNCALAIQGGIFDGAVVLVPQLQSSASISGGSLLKSANAEPGKEDGLTLAATAKVTDNGTYWVVSEKEKATIAITEGNFTVSGVKDGDEVYVGATITFTVAANTGYTLGDVTVNAGVVTPEETVYSYTVQDADKTVTIAAATTVNTYTISYTDGFDTYQTDSYTVENYNEKVLWNGARTGYTFDNEAGWTDDDGVKVTDLAAYLKDKADDIELEGSWEAIEYKVTVTVKDNVGGNASANPATYTVNDIPEIWLTATAAPNYKFKQWTKLKGDATISDSTSYETTLNIVTGTTGDIEIEAEFEADGPVDPVDGDLDPDGEANLQALKAALPQGTDINAWATAVYGTDGKIPADKLNDSSEELVKAAAAYNLKIMADPVTVAVAATDAANTFKFTLTDKDGANPIVAATLIQKLVKYTTALGEATPFAESHKNAVDVKFVDGGFTAELTGKDASGDPANAGFMKVDLSVAE